MNAVSVSLSARDAANAHHARSVWRCQAFTLIELLIVIGIIGVLASLVLGVSGVASRKAREARVRAELNRLATEIEGYKSRLGFYPPSNERLLNVTAASRSGVAAVNQLFYELSGTLFDGAAGAFHPVGQDVSAGLALNQIVTLFATDGFANSARAQRGTAGLTDTARSRRDVRYSATLRPSGVKLVQWSGIRYTAMVVPIPVGNNDRIPANVITLFGADQSRVFPWYYDSSSPHRFNLDGFDLWTEVVIGRKVLRISNWEPSPVVIGSF